MTAAAIPTRPQVLILDDEHGMCELVADVGDDMGFDTQWCDNFRDFSAHFSTGLRGIFLDLAMPGMDGIEIIRFLGDNHSTAHLVLMSGHDVHVLEAARRLAESRGLKVTGVLHKPFDLAALSAIYDVLAAVADPTRPADGATASRFAPTAQHLRAALAAGHVVPYFQPKFSVATREVVGAEVLARWIDPDHGMISPDRFIALAESEGMIDDLTDGIVDRALDQCRVWRREGKHPRIALNLSPLSLNRLDLPDLLLRKVMLRGLFPDTITIEITETALAKDYSASLDILTRMRMRRIGLSIDDFGTGYSSFKQLQNGPFTELKIDQSFIAKALEEESSRAIVESSVQLGHRLGLKVVAEGVETEDQLDFIKRLGCEEAQGYLLGRPCAAEVFPWAVQGGNHGD
jgi:EAL domain-containing protein (putative c-di-GMP-specific phosphodiesterase class I)